MKNKNYSVYATNGIGIIKSPKGAPKGEPRAEVQKTEGDLRSKKRG